MTIPIDHGQVDALHVALISVILKFQVERGATLRTALEVNDAVAQLTAWVRQQCASGERDRFDAAVAKYTERT